MVEGERDECGPQARTFSYRHTSSGGVMGGMVAITNNAIVDIRKFLREWILKVLIMGTKLVTIHGDGCSLNLQW